MNGEETRGCVYLVGAGPGALDLVTLRARELIRQADVLVYDYLCNPEMLQWARADSEKIYAGKSAAAHTLTQKEINDLLVARAKAGKTVVRLKGGDPYVFGRGGEEAQVLARAGVPFEVVPGVTSAIAAAAYAGIPVTHRDFASTVTFVTGHEDPTKEASSIDWRHLAQLRGTKVFLMGVERLREIAQRLVAEGADPATPVALVRWGTTPRQEASKGRWPRGRSRGKAGLYGACDHHCRRCRQAEARAELSSRRCRSSRAARGGNAHASTGERVDATARAVGRRCA